jgi:hypothetical protein
VSILLLGFLPKLAKETGETKKLFPGLVDLVVAGTLNCRQAIEFEVIFAEFSSQVRDLLSLGVFSVRASE